MAKRIVTKKDLLKALNKTKSEYDDNTHSCNVSDCAVCQIFNVNHYPVKNCGRCPMEVFSTIGNCTYNCMNRRCEPIDCSMYWKRKDSLKIEAVRDFYKKFIKKVEKMTEVELQETDWKFLIALDRRVANKYGVVNGYANNHPVK